MVRYFAQVYLQSIDTKESGDFSGEGQWYFRADDARMPTEGYFNIRAYSCLKLNPMPMIWSCVEDADEGNFKFNFRAMEHDIGNDDEMFEREISMPFSATDPQTGYKLELTSKDEKIKINLVIRCDPLEN
eukprot:JZ554051.1.p1 GENE.JZ554051.1~~JZ554051.1.p1  ORF type:complete len:130 (+),score=53.96 JZ554051.1:29-418(+)